MEKREKAATGADSDIKLETVQREQREKKVPGFLWRGRMLQFHGVFADADDGQPGVSRTPQPTSAPLQGAPNVYQSGRMTNQELDSWRTELEGDLAKIQQLR